MGHFKDDRNATLMALTSSALLLPAYQGAMADAQPEFAEIGMRYSKYQEDDILSNKAFGGDSERHKRHSPSRVPGLDTYVIVQEFDVLSNRQRHRC